MQKSLEMYSVIKKKTLAAALAFVFVLTTALFPANTAFADGGGGMVLRNRPCK
ncbi:MAG: hypothetical protein LBL36_07690 [Clostridiales Family XIII bacterium]|nr:hypothetical protein [Clostridiales Family XIII bacterium]